MNKTKTMFLFLQLFADGGAEGNATGTESGETGMVAASQSGENKLPIKFLDEPEKTTAEDPAAEDSQKADEPDLEAEFDALIKKDGKFAEVFQKRFKTALDGRMKASKQQNETFEKQQKVMQKLAQVYGVNADDIDGIESAINADDSLFSAAAEKANMSVEQFKELADVKAKNAMLEKANEYFVNQQHIQEINQRWAAESEQLRGKYPNFDFRHEIENNDLFGQLLRNGLSVENAFIASHIEDILPETMRVATKDAEIALSKSLAANRARPDENASSRNAAATAKRDVASLTDEELDEIDRLSRQRRITL